MRVLYDRPLGSVPFQVHAVIAPRHATPTVFLPASALARAERFALLHDAVTRRLGDRWRLVVATHAAFWAAVYGYYWILA